jgi:hypothetical protein
MRLSRFPFVRALCLCATLFVTGCETEKSQNPLSPDIAGPIPGVSISAPRAVEPLNGVELVAGRPVALSFDPASSTSVRPAWYQIELAGDSQFAQKLYTADKVEPASSGRTTHTIPATLAVGRYYWRARALDGANTGPYSAAAEFAVVTPVEIETPTPVFPVRREVTPTNTPEFIVTNGKVTGNAGTVVYRFEVANDQAFTSVAAVVTVARSTGTQTTMSLGTLPYSKEFYWRVSATNGVITSQPSLLQAFQTPAAPPPPPTPTPTPTPNPTPNPGGGTVGGARSISPDEALALIRAYHDQTGANLGSSSTREQRVAFFFEAVASLHYGHPRWNPKGPDSNWCVKDAGGGRPPSDDVLVRCSSRESWDLIGGAGGNGYSFHLDYIGVLPSGQNVYPPPRSSLPR